MCGNRRPNSDLVERADIPLRKRNTTHEGPGLVLNRRVSKENRDIKLRPRLRIA